MDDTGEYFDDPTLEGRTLLPVESSRGRTRSRSSSASSGTRSRSRSPRGIDIDAPVAGHLSLSSARVEFDALLRRVRSSQRDDFAEYTRAACAKAHCGDVEAEWGVVDTVRARLPLLMGLMVFQSLSSFILSGYATFIKQHVIVTLYLTMLVGAGGNAGNQAAVHMIRRVALKQEANCWKQMVMEAKVGWLLGALLCGAGFARVYFIQGSAKDAIAIALSLFIITTLSVVIGTLLPLAIDRMGYDSAHAGPSIQVIMDILGVFTTCQVCKWFLDDGKMHTYAIG